MLGFKVGLFDGCKLGCEDGKTLGLLNFWTDGRSEGLGDGIALRSIVGLLLGRDDGLKDGE
jgi:hypothetical protein